MKIENPLDLITRLRQQPEVTEMPEVVLPSPMHQRVSAGLRGMLSHMSRSLPSTMGMATGVMQGFIDSQIANVPEAALEGQIRAAISMMSSWLEGENDGNATTPAVEHGGLVAESGGTGDNPGDDSSGEEYTGGASNQPVEDGVRQQSDDTAGLEAQVYGTNGTQWPINPRDW